MFFWQHEAVPLEGYSLGSVGQQGLAHIVEGPKGEGRTRSLLWASSGNTAFFGDNYEIHPATLCVGENTAGQEETY